MQLVGKALLRHSFDCHQRSRTRARWTSRKTYQIVTARRILRSRFPIGKVAHHVNYSTHGPGGHSPGASNDHDNVKLEEHGYKASILSNGQLGFPQIRSEKVLSSTDQIEKSAETIQQGEVKVQDPKARSMAADDAQRSVNDGVPSSPANENGAMSRRLEQLTEDSLATGGGSARRAVADAGFNEDLRRRLEERILSANGARAEHPQAFATLNLPEFASKSVRDVAGAKPWTGQEAVEDTALRMLTDVHKPLRGPKQPVRVLPASTKPKRQSIGRRIADARIQASQYSDRKDSDMNDQEKEEYRKELQARFQPAARHMPATLSGLASLANERIEEAIARGQFKNLPRGKLLERDPNASSQFLDTTEYLLNRIIARQEIVPPWIEKQQEVLSAVRVFRARLRNDWRRHAARMIASKGGSLEEKIQRAKEYAAAELQQNTLAPILLQDVEDISHPDSSASLDNRQTLESTAGPVTTAASFEGSVDPGREQSNKRMPFRDLEWQATELSFQTASITAINNLTRSYNLMAPELAKKPYYNLDRELKACFAEVAPQLPNEIRERALTPKLRTRPLASSSGISLLERFEKDKALVHDEDIRKKGYGWREFWKDMWGSGKTIPR